MLWNSITELIILIHIQQSQASDTTVFPFFSFLFFFFSPPKVLEGFPAIDKIIFLKTEMQHLFQSLLGPEVCRWGWENDILSSLPAAKLLEPS